MSVADVVIGIAALLGSSLIALAGFGVVRLGDVYARMHAATKASTLGIGLVAVAGALGIDGGAGPVILSAVAIFITAPSAAHLIGRGAYRAEGIEVHLDGDDDLREIVDREEEAG
jgi:multicomponent Na+:H+ antiporter subunit G